METPIIGRLIYLRCIDKAELMSEHAPITSRSDMKKICVKYFSHGTSDSIMRMTALATNWSASGRGLEVRTATFNLYNFDRINHVIGYLWTQRKTTKSKCVWFVPDHDCPFLDHYCMSIDIQLHDLCGQNYIG